MDRFLEKQCPCFLLGCVMCVVVMDRMLLICRHGLQVPVANYLKRLEKAGFNVLEPKLQTRDGINY